MADIKSDANVNKCSLCFITLTCIVEEQFANSIMHDQNLTFKVCKKILFLKLKSQRNAMT